jgi:hypothetical protein
MQNHTLADGLTLVVLPDKDSKKKKTPTKFQAQVELDSDAEEVDPSQK